MRKLLLAAAFSAAATANAASLEDLKNTPASRYDILVNRALIATVSANDLFRDYRIAGTPFKYQSTLFDKDDFSLTIRATGPGRDINTQGCEQTANHARERLDFDRLLEEDGMQFTYKAELSADENPALKITCSI